MRILHKKLCLLMFLLTGCSLGIFAQNRTITGTVRDAVDVVIGASVTVKGNSSIGTITDMDGKFRISVPSSARDLVIKFIGYDDAVIRLGTPTDYKVTLKESSVMLEEVVAIGYAKVKRKDLTGAISSVGGKELANVPVTTAMQALQGKAAGVNIVTESGAPGAGANITIRGGMSLTQSTEPLYIVDGFPVSSISDIAPTDIQSVDVLKDASSTAIYGARGANGVIIITTKSGAEGKTQVNFGASYGFRNVIKQVGVLDPYEFSLYQYELDQSGTSYGAYKDLEIYKSKEGSNWQDQLFGRTGNQQQYNISVSGGTKSTKFNISYARNDEKSIMRGSGYSKNNINAKINTEINKWLSLDFNARLIQQKIDGLSGGADNESSKAYSLVARAITHAPVKALNEDSEDDENSTNARYTPLERVDATYKQQRRFRQDYNVGINWEPLKGLKFRSEFGYGWKFDDTDQVWGYKATANSKFGHGGLPQAYLTNSDNKNWRNANTLTYENKKLFNGRDRLNVMIGHEVSTSQDTKKYVTSVDFSKDATTKEILAALGNGTALPTSTYIGIKDNLLSFFGRANYTLMDKYLFTFTMRADGSSKFAKGSQWGYFPSGAIAWRIYDEAFMNNAKEWLSNLKLRVSYGTAGNNRIPSGSMYTTYSVAGTSEKGIYFDETTAVVLKHGNVLSNPGLKWETTVSRNAGIDFGFFNNRLSGAIDVYWNTTKDLLMKTTIASSSGYSYQYKNMGQTSNKGVELQLDAVLVDAKDFGLNFNFNISYNRGKIDKLNGSSFWQSSSWAGTAAAGIEDFLVEEGGRLGEVYGYKTDGFYTADDFTFDAEKGTYALKAGVNDCSSLIGGKVYPGSIKLKANEDGEYKKERLGNTVPTVSGGFGLNARWKGFDFTAFFNYSLGNKIVNATKLGSSFYSGSSKNWNINDHFTSANRYSWIDPSTGTNLLSSASIKANGEAWTINRLNEVNTGSSIWNPAAATVMPLVDWAVEDGSFLRVNNITIGYTLPKLFVSKLNIQNIRIYVTGYNLHCFTKYSGTDPEVDCCTSTPMTPGIDYAAYPKSRSFVGGINVTF